MARYRRRRRRRWARPGLLLPTAAALATGVWWVYLREDSPARVDRAIAPGLQATLTTDRPEILPESRPKPDVSEKGESPSGAQHALSRGGPAAANDSQVGRGRSLIAAGRQAVERNEFVAARNYLSEALRSGVEESDASLLRAELTRIGNETIFSSRILADDPLVSRYVIKPGDTLGKIAKANKVSADFLASINNIADKNRIRAGQVIKVAAGPFHAMIDKGTYTLEVYLGRTFVKHFRVGLGADDTTPSGEWRVDTKLKNPTYYPPRGGQIVAADDPENPLGERWIGLEGISGEAAGLLRYGIHGTIEPESIGQSVSLGCIRMYNEDVEALYTYLVEKHSTVTVRE